MYNNKKIRVFALLIELLQRKKTVDFKTIKKHLSTHDIDASDRTIERYIADLRTDFGLLIDCDRRTNLYSIAESTELNSLLHFIHLFNSSELIFNALQHKDKTLSCLAFEATGDYVGSSNLEPIYSAIVQSKIITFDHENYEKNTVSRRTLMPYLLKEYNSKWYVVGTIAGSEQVRIFGLDRIRRLEISDQTFEKTEQKRISEVFDYTLGLVFDVDKPTTVVLSATPFQAKYFKNAPLHATQQLVSEDEKEVIFKYWLVPNRELQRLILGYSSQVKVLEPEWFAKQIKGQIGEMAALYKKSLSNG
ncbi:WYL domain-containing protein [Bacteroidia bacterium]|nr:WYL domain-containing protein [Bacteroidia bacterium]